MKEALLTKKRTQHSNLGAKCVFYWAT